MEERKEMPLEQAGRLAGALVENICKVVVGKPAQVRLVVAALLAGGHALLEDVPGTGKTLLARALAKSVACAFGRVQFTPDLLPSELTGLQFYHPKTGEFTFRQGALFANILLADEINRATPRTQSGLLESMEEHQVSVDGETHPLPRPFFVIATQNPVETQGTFPLPEAQLDRFLVRLSLGYPDEAESVDVLRRHVAARPLQALEPVCTGAEVLAMQAAAAGVYLHDKVMRYIVRLAEATRGDADVLLGASTRACIALARVGQAAALMDGRGYVTPDDIKPLVPAVFCHRLLLRAAGYGAAGGQGALRVAEAALATVPVPVENWGRPA